ncbi:chloride channel protein [Nakamurella lactea]|uniref:chloride channel protein n=1 Tax=Nakamurella lactea TaxID=459515 RepID=UPI000A03BB6B|nr:chloride channel protein [Nakamurella lactea]
MGEPSGGPVADAGSHRIPSWGGSRETVHYLALFASVNSAGEGDRVDLHSRGYLRLLLVTALLGVPLSLIAFGFLVAVHQLEHVVWQTVPHALGFAEPPAWWPILTIGIAGALVALAVTHLPGRGGHAPVEGLGAGAMPPIELPGVLLAAAASLVGGAVVGPEAPLIALGSGLALLAVRGSRTARNGTTATIIAAAGSAAAISAIFGNPLVAAVIFLEVLGLGRRQLMLVVLPCLLSSGVGALLFTGMGRWTGLEIGALTIGELEPSRLQAIDVVLAIPLAAVVALATWCAQVAGRRTARLAASHPLPVTVVAGGIAGVSACVYAVITGHSPMEVALSGQATLPTLATDPGAWTTGALVALLLCKGVAYAVCLGTFRGGPVFPAVFLGAALGVLAEIIVPGMTPLSALAVGLAAGAATTGLPVTSVIMVVLLLGDAAAGQMPVVILGVVTAMVALEFLPSTQHTDWRTDSHAEVPT